MLRITQHAKRHLLEFRERRPPESQVQPRLAIDPAEPRVGNTSLVLKLDEPRPEDEIIVDGEEVLLLVQASLAHTLEGQMLDAEPTTNGAAFLIKPDGQKA